MTTPILDITEIANGQTDQYLTANEAFRALEAAAYAALAVDLSGGDVELTDEELRGYGQFVCSGQAADQALDVPADIPKTFVVWNTDATYDVDVDVVGGSSPIAVAPGDSGFFAVDGAGGITRCS
jgi:hypothetical protein